MGKNHIIAIDGPAGAGKSTIAKLVAEKLGYTYLDTGAMYRAVTLAWLKGGKPFSEELLGEISEQILIRFCYQNGEKKLFLNDEDVTKEIRTPQVTENVSRVSAVGRVREAMVMLQRKIAEDGRVILDGRDIGTVVFPYADHKIFLTASIDERARRRYLENKEKGLPADLEKIKEEIAARDKFDSEREISPLKQAEDAILLDTSDMDIPQVVAKMLEICGEG